MWTYALSEDGTRYNPTPVQGKDAIAEWLRAAMQTARGEQPHLPPNFGVDVIRILSGDAPEYYLQASIEETCATRGDIALTSCTCKWEGTSMYATCQFQTIYGEITLTNVPVPVSR